MFRIISTNISNYLPKQWYISNRCVSISVSHLNRQRNHFEERERWSRLYTFSDMPYLAINTKLKVYPAVTTCLGTPLGFIVDTAGLIPQFQFFPYVFYIGFIVTSILCASSVAISGTIGKIDVNQKRDLKLYYIDFFGRQIVKETTADELRKCKKSDLKFKLYKTIDTTDAKGQPIQLKIAPNRADINDVTLFKKLIQNKNKS